MNSSLLTSKNILIALLVLIILWLALCNRKDTNTGSNPPKVVPSVVYNNNIIIDSIALKRVTDSLKQYVVNPALSAADYWQKQFKQSVLHSNQQADVFNDILNKACPDTSGRVKAEFAIYRASVDKAANECDSTIKAKDKAYEGQVAITNATEATLQDIRSDFRQALRSKDTLQAFIDKLPSGRSVSLGIAGSIGAFNGLGPAIGYQDKKGNQLDYSLQFINGVKIKQHTLILKKILFRL
jgi:hypothetical protein